MSTVDEVPAGSLRDAPNAITAARVVVTLALFVALSVGWSRAAVVLFLLAGGTDWVDGFWARRWGPITKLGRVLDPFADKLLICGTFVFLAADEASRVAPWMAVVILARELLVTALRSAVEARGGDFSAKWLGKQKMAWQCIAATLGLLLASPWRCGGWPIEFVVAPWLMDGSIAITLLLTVASGVTYARAAVVSTKEPA
ncbi:MAG: CDP-diacylglycerol--glycerol-3-phosphate 3-phosphatidyltransferase [Lacipirellulaceae bacterium]